MFGRHSGFLWGGGGYGQGGDPACWSAGRGRGRGGFGRHGGFQFGGTGGFESPFGRFPFGRFPFGGQRARRGDVRAAILALLAEQPRNGYQIMQELDQRSRGMWRPSPGSVYPALQQLQDEGLIRDEPEGGGRTFHLTDAGREYVRTHPEEVRAPWQEIGEEEEGGRELLGTLRDMGVAIWQISRIGTARQQAEARKLLEETRRALYRILASDAGRRDG